MIRPLLTLLILLPMQLYAQLVINEIMPKNISFNMDESWNYSMWVEVYNSGEASINLSNYFFSTDLSGTTKWQPLDTIIESKAYLLLYFERADRIGHASFKLEPKGGDLYLLDASLSVIDQVTYPEQYRNISYGRKTDVGNDWVYFESPSPGKSNNEEFFGQQRCANPVFTLRSGFYSGSQNISFENLEDGSSIYYTLDNTEPNLDDYLYTPGNSITLDTTVMVRAKAIGSGMLSSDVVAATYFIDERKPEFRVVSIATDDRYLYNDTIGIYCDGTNGILGNLQKTPKNFNQDWDRPVSFEFFDEAGELQLNQELDIRILGGGSRDKELKSISLSPKKKFGENKLNYDFFTTKPNHKYKDIMMRNGGNDDDNLFKDPFLQSIIVGRMDLDYQAYEPAVIYINGKYRGMENMRERTNKDFVYSNHGLDDDEVYLIEATYKGVDLHNDMPTDPEFIALSDFLKNNPMQDSANYAKACEMMDVEELINYMITETFVSNVDWPYNNVKMWKPINGGKWRWILLDLEYSYSTSRIDHNSILFAMGQNNSNVIGGYDETPEWSIVVFRELMKNETFKNKFIDRYAIHLSTTFQPSRINHLMDSMANRIRNEQIHHQNLYGMPHRFDDDLAKYRTFTEKRASNVLKQISRTFLRGTSIYEFHISSDIAGATYQLNSQNIIDTEADISFFKGRDMEIKAIPPPGWQFKHWLFNEEIHEDPTFKTTFSGPFSLQAVFDPVEITQEPSILINELMASNQIHEDEYGDTDDYIELYNVSPQDVNIGGWYITDNLADKTKYQFPTDNPEATTIHTNERKILWADDDDIQGPLHLNFKLNKEGEKLGLYQKTGSEIIQVDLVEYPQLTSNISYARKTDGADQWVITQPSFNETNVFVEFVLGSEQQQVQVFPTLFENEIEVKNALGKTIRIFDIHGRSYSNRLCKTKDEVINLYHLPSGLYLMKIDQETFRIIKQ